MVDIKDLAAKRSALLEFDPRILKVKPGLNVRDLSAPDNRAHVEELCESIGIHGVRTPLEIFREGEDVFVSSGHCRLAAVMLAIKRGHEIATVPCVPEPRGRNDIDRIAGQFIFNSGKSLNAIEQGANIKRLLGFGLTVAQIAPKIGKSVSFVNQALDFQEAPPEAHRMVATGEVAPTLAASEVRKHGPKKGVERLRQGVAKAKAQGKPKATARTHAAGRAEPS